MQNSTNPIGTTGELANGRLPVEEMNDRQIAVETLILLRAFGDALEAASSNPMVRAMIPGLNGK